MGHHGKIVQHNEKGRIESIGYVIGTESLTMRGGPSGASNPFKNYYYVNLVSNVKITKNKTIEYNETQCFMSKKQALSYSINKDYTIKDCLTQPQYWSIFEPNILVNKDVKSGTPYDISYSGASDNENTMNKNFLTDKSSNRYDYKFTPPMNFAGKISDEDFKINNSNKN